ncbi:MAG: sugar ABC transporter permease [Oscillospiraceae bacterium]|jgi:multiple sugar transport system permease protein|nr:sugar ABC transporter permease [Oscillospiraceae bacterium]MCI1990215.1 sugar ABC transporter permease [Oscillospiraceae bacterium]MCI2035927.1 sugar ABC transporter permease [Oscillospiraceae bacterium]
MTAAAVPVKKVSLKKRKILDNLTAYSFIAPNFIGFAVFTLVPIVMAVGLSFMEWNGSGVQSPKYIGLGNYAHLFRDGQFIEAFFNTIIYTAATVPFTMFLALLLAIVLNQKIFARSFFRTVSFFPYVASLVAVAAVWNALFSPTAGPVNQILMSLGVKNPPGWAADVHWAMVTLILFSIWKNVGYYMVMYLAGLQSINPELYEAASLDGANTVQKFFQITIPQLGHTTFLVMIMVTIQCFKVYDIVLMITNGGPGTKTQVLVFYIYNVAFNNWDLGYASAISMVLFVLVLVVTLVMFRRERTMSN